MEHNHESKHTPYPPPTRKWPYKFLEGLGQEIIFPFDLYQNNFTTCLCSHIDAKDGEEKLFAF